LCAFETIKHRDGKKRPKHGKFKYTLLNAGGDFLSCRISYCKCAIPENVYILFVGVGLGGGDAIFVGLHVNVFFP